ncbi:MAG: hypothetical protein ACRERD_20925, partial [Candidatus Binatia bacterium]
PAAEVLVAEGQKLAFAIEAESPQNARLGYKWFVNGKKRGEGKRWNYQPSYDEGGDNLKEVKVSISDGKSPAVERSWQVRVQNVNRPPVILRRLPQDGPVEVTAGESRNFSVVASDPDKDDRLTYLWSVDGEKIDGVAGNTWQFPSSSAAGRREVAVQVVDEAGENVQMAWNVTVKALVPPLVITSAEPRSERVITQIGNPLDFSVMVDSPSETSQELQRIAYRWSVDDASPQRTETGRFRFAETTPGTYRLMVVAVSPEGRQSAPKRWTVEVKAPPPPPLPPREIDGAVLTEPEVRNWLESYQQALAGKDVDELVRMGMISSRDAPTISAALQPYKSYSVLLQNVDIRASGNQATVTFSRVDTIDGKRMRPVGLAVTVEKKGGRITKRN